MILKFDLSAEWKVDGAAGVPLAEALAHVFENSGGGVGQCRKLTGWAAELRRERCVAMDAVDFKELAWPALERGDLKAPIKVAIADALDRQREEQEKQGSAGASPAQPCATRGAKSASNQ